MKAIGAILVGLGIAMFLRSMFEHALNPGPGALPGGFGMGLVSIFIGIWLLKGLKPKQ